jgi:hypothetical protein
MDVPFVLEIDVTHASTRGCYVAVMAVKEFSPAAARTAAAATNVNECSALSARGR